jgi:LysR family cyn operon transcriptional activator
MNYLPINLKVLRSFLILANSSSYIKAAESLNITQSALSQQMQELAHILGSPIFERVGRKSTLSKFGIELLKKVEPLVGNLDETLLTLKNSSNSLVGQLNIGATNTYLKSIALPACLHIFDNYPGLRINLREASAKDLVNELNEGSLDLALLPDEYQTENLNHRFLFKEQFCVIGLPSKIAQFPQKVNLKTLEPYEVALLNKNFLMRQKIDFQCKREGVILKNRLELSSMADLIDVVKAGRVIAIGSSIACHGQKSLEAKIIIGEHLSREATLYWRDGVHQTSAMKVFQKATVDIARKLFIKKS